MNKKAARIAELNNRLRTTFDKAHGHVTVTRGIAKFSPHDLAEIFNRVMKFDTFTPDNDPYGEHDLGAFDFKGEKIMWKIDYHAKDNLNYGSEDPADESKTTRIMTIMLGREY